jgi:hypothetical protein
MTDETGPAPGAPGQPRFHVVAGHPTEEEAAAVAAVLSAVLARRAAAAAAAPPPAAPRGAWADRRRVLQGRPTPSPGAWRRSALPR